MIKASGGKHIFFAIPKDLKKKTPISSKTKKQIYSGLFFDTINRYPNRIKAVNWQQNHLIVFPARTLFFKHYLLVH